MSYLALYRKYRPTNFDDMVGQSEVVEIIKREVISNKISHAYLFAGPRGTGKTSTAKILAKMVNCENLSKNGEPCGCCDSCVNFNSSNDIVEIDAASNNGVDEIRELRDKVNLVPSSSKYKVYIIDEVHMLTVSAFNALLKTLEEPPSHVIFILATTEFYKIPVTVVSRCQKFQFSRVSIDSIVLRLKNISIAENISVTDDVLYEIARLSDGGMRDAINMLDQLSSFSDNNIVLDDVYKLSGTYSYDDLHALIFNIFNKNYNDIVNFCEDLASSGKNISKFIEELIFYVRDILYFKTVSSFKNLKSDNIKAIVDLYSENKFLELIISLNELLSQIKKSSVPYVLLSVSLIKISKDIDKDSIENVHVVEESFKETKKEPEKNGGLDVIEEVSKISVYNTFDEKLRQIRINNTFSTASKDKLIKLKEDWKKIDGILFDSEYGTVAGLLKDVDVIVAGDKNIMLLAKYDSLLERLYNNICLIENLIYDLFNIDYKIVFLASDEWKYEKNKYVENLKNGYKYTYICEKEENVNNNSVKNNDIDKITSIIGEDIIEYV